MRIGVSALGVQAAGSGVDRYLFRILEHLIRDTSNEVIVFGRSGTLPAFLYAAKNVEVRHVGPRWQFGVGRILWHQTAMLIAAATGRLDVMWIPNNRLILLKNVPIVMTVHDLAEFAIPGKYDPLRMFYRRTLMRLALRRVDHVLTDSENSARDLRSIMGVPSHKLTVSLLAADGGPSHNDEAACDRSRVAKYNISRPFILAVGRLEHPGKNLIRAMDVVSKVRQRLQKDYDFVIVGRDSFRASLIHAHAQLPGFEFVTILPFVNDRELHELYKASEVLLFLSLYEGFGLPPLEAMSLGTPVVSSNRASLPEVIGDAGLLVDPEDEAAIVGSLSTLLLDPTQRAQLRKAGTIRAAQFSWRKTASIIKSVLEETAAATNRRSKDAGGGLF